MSVKNFSNNEIKEIVNIEPVTIWIIWDEYQFELIPIGKSIVEGKEQIKCVDLSADPNNHDNEVIYFTEKEIIEGHELYKERYC